MYSCLQLIITDVDVDEAINAICVQVYTSDCTGCTTEGVVIRLLGERNFDYMTGTPCTTNILDLPGSQEYGSSTSSEFEDRDQLGACYQVQYETLVSHHLLKALKKTALMSLSKITLALRLR